MPVLVGVLVAVSVAIQWFVVTTHRIPVGADQAVVGLMARHILHGRGHPVFYYGATYAGSLEPHFVAGVFAVLGASVSSFRIAMAFLFFGILVAVSLLTRRLFGATAALFALAYLSIAPFFLLYKGLTSDGAYDTVALLSLALIGLAIAIDQRGRAGALALLSLGAVAGLAFWVMPHTLALSLVVFGWVCWRPELRKGIGARVSTLLAGFIAGASPWWIWNLRHHWAALNAPELATVGVRRAARNLLEQVWISLPTLEGGFVATPDDTMRRETFPLSRPLSVLCLAVLFTPAAVRAFRGDRRCRLLLAASAALFAAACFSGRLLLTEPRYLFSYYVVAVPLLGFGFSKLLTGRWKALAWTSMAALLGVHAASVVVARVSYRNVDAEVTGPLGGLISYLEVNGLNRVYASYWTAYRLSFESGERVVATPVPGDELVRYEPALQEVNAAPTPAVALLDRRDQCFRHFLQERKLPFRRDQVGNFGVYSELPEQALAPIRASRGLPLPDEAYRVRWLAIPQTRSVRVGSEQTVRVSFRNPGPCRWRTSIHLGYHWTPLEPGPALFDSPRGFLPAGMLDPDESATVSVQLRAPDAPGSYRLDYDLVNENVDWFSTRGGQTASQRVEVR